jgi:excisionase family DNA binding protein
MMPTNDSTRDDNNKSPAFPPPPDYSSWLKKAEVATALNVATKTVEVMARNGKIEQALWKRPGGGPALAVFHPGDVARLYAEKYPERPAFVLPAARTPDPGGNGHDTHSHLARAQAPATSGAEALQTFLEMFAAALAISQRSQASQNSENVALTVEEASAETHCTRGYIRRQMREGKLPFLRDRPRRIWRADLAKLRPSP